MRGFILTPAEARRVKDAVQERERRSRNKLPQLKKRVLVNGSSGCPEVHQIAIHGEALAGTFDLDVAIDPDGGGAGSPETLTFDFDFTASEVKTEYETHSAITSGDIDVIGGPLPDVAVYVVFLTTGTLNRTQALPTPDSSSLSGGRPVAKVAKAAGYSWE